MVGEEITSKNRVLKAMFIRFYENNVVPFNLFIALCWIVLKRSEIHH